MGVKVRLHYRLKWLQLMMASLGLLVGFGQLDTNLDGHIWEEGILIENISS